MTLENPIEACRVCGAVLLPGAGFCERCGSPRGAAPAPRAPRQPSPTWLTRDWPLAAGLALLVAAALLASCVAYGLGLGALVAGSGGIVPGALVGAVLPFAAYGGEVVAASGTDDSNLVLLMDQMPLVLTALAAVLTWLALRRGVRGSAAEPARARALVVKVGGLLALLVAVAGAFANVGDAESFFGSEEQVDRITITTVAQGRAALGALVVVALVGALLLVRARIPVSPRWSVTATRCALAARAGAAALVAVVLLTGIATLIGTGVAADGGRDRLALVAAAPLTLTGFGISASAVAHGGAVATTDVDEALDDAIDDVDRPRPGRADESDLDARDVTACEQDSDTFAEEQDCLDGLVQDLRDNGGADGSGQYADDLRAAFRLSAVERTGTHVSLTDWALPLTQQGGTAPWWAFLGLLVPFAALSGSTLLLLRRACPPTEGWALSLAALLGIGYALASWLLAALSPLALLGSGSELTVSQFSFLLVPSLGSSLGLPLLWAAVVPTVTALVFAQRRGLPGNVFAARPAAGAPMAGVPAAGGPVAGAQTEVRGELLQGSSAVGCRTCGAALEPDAAFCSTCGRPT